MANNVAFLCVFAAAALAVVWGMRASSSTSSAFRVDNFSAGPGALPLAVLQRAQAEFLSWGVTRGEGPTGRGMGMNIMEMSHRDAGGPVQSMIAEAEASVRRQLDVPDNYHVLYMGAGAHAQFAAIPMNLMHRGSVGGAAGHKQAQPADYVVTGYWSERARAEAEKQKPSRAVVGATADGTRLLPPSEWQVNPRAAYIHICASETIDGLEFLEDPVLPQAPNVPIVADFTSTLLSRRVNVSRYGVIYASGGKNVGPSGMLLLIVRDDLVSEEIAAAYTPSVLSWHLQAKRLPIPSIYNTPPTFNIYMHGLVMEHLEANGGLEAMEARAKRRADAVYGAVAASNGFYVAKVTEPSHRSRMNVPMTIGLGDTRRRDLEKLFVEEAARDHNMLQLFGHPVRGGLRVTLYRGVPDDAVARCVEFMNGFAARHALDE